MMIKLLICDLDGTLIHSAPGIVATAQDMLKHFNYPEVPHDKIISAIGHGLRQFLIDLLPEIEAETDKIEELENTYRKIYQSKYLHQAQEFNHVYPYLESTPYKISIVTNKREEDTHLTLAHLPIGQLSWTHIVGADTYPERKPHPLPLLKTLEVAQVAPHEALMIGDGIPDVLSAQRAGIPMVAVNYGYTPIELLKEAGARHFISQFQELPSLIEKIY